MFPSTLLHQEVPYRSLLRESREAGFLLIKERSPTAKDNAITRLYEIGK
jgi:hypothetical protein